MNIGVSRSDFRRRGFLRAASLVGLGIVESALMSRSGLADAETDARQEIELIETITGKIATLSSRVHLNMPAVFGNGYSVPMSLTVDSPMTAADHVRLVRVVAPKNPIVLVANFQFSPTSGQASVTTRIRLAQPQNVLALAEMSDGALLMARTWVKVDLNGCS